MMLQLSHARPGGGLVVTCCPYRESADRVYLSPSLCARGKPCVCLNYPLVYCSLAFHISSLLSFKCLMYSYLYE